MGRKMSKSQRTQARKKRAQAKIKKMENQDAKGISRKELKGALNPKIFIILKIISIVMIPISYLLFSPLLIVCVIFSILMFVFASMTEKHINHTFIKSNHIKLLKIDSIIAVIVLLIAIAGFTMSFMTKRKMPFGGTGMQILIKMENFGACQTGRRSLIKLAGLGMKFGNVSFPDKMPTMPPAGFKKPDFKPSLDDIPLEAVLSQTISAINTVLIFSISAAGIGTLVHYYYRKKKFDKEMNEITIDALPDMDTFDFDKIFMFGYIKTDEIDSDIEQPSE